GEFEKFAVDNCFISYLPISGRVCSIGKANYYTRAGGNDHTAAHGNQYTDDPNAKSDKHPDSKRNVYTHAIAHPGRCRLDSVSQHYGFQGCAA
ncbi:MAG: hypothetical protein JXA42_26965, partial [Anaerolineales bacterium]|nr:hypothetical protein [Anaerolineales bacterium]